ncbi:Putative carboxylesterase, type B, carboxylesterase type B, active, alpha/Beta hydrolase [Colletotrichum destructivum]|uniref:Carboxylic ester hydrolase n=1 Tax=Colletotrichum destructivum TaxID=34406 RepID=A0AAX4INS5_9PEZI|nr:Putative carboxylesterase, type B, carboxylesterase type B, active, alpha/Beta hydrolase [Colletotrichum destructivum]
MSPSTLVFVCLIALTWAAPQLFGGPQVTIKAPQATLKGSTKGFLGAKSGEVESFMGIPYAKPPIGELRFKAPVRLTESLGEIDVTTEQPESCPQFVLKSDFGSPLIPPGLLDSVLNLPILQNLAVGKEDCLTINVQRPAGTKEGAKLPVMYWIFGGGFELGSTSMYNGAGLVAEGMSTGKPFIFVAVNYRVGAWGFMPGKDLMDEGNSNAGLLDQRMGLEWVQDNIASFGGDPEKVTLWGESAGAISIFSQFTLFNGNITRNGKALFRGAIMNSGSAVPTDPMDSPKATKVYEQVLSTAGCSGAKDRLGCLRKLSYEDMRKAANSVPGLLSYSSVALSYLPRPDGKNVPSSPEVFATTGKLPKIPFILGDQEDEGTLFALFQPNITNTKKIEEYLSTLYFNNASPQQIKELVATYNPRPSEGSPFRTAGLNEIRPQFKRLAAILGDAVFTLTRRAVFSISQTVQPEVNNWSYLASYDYGTPVLGTFHGSDLLQVFFGIKPNYAAAATRAYYFNFAYNLDPNNSSGGTGTAKVKLIDWPKWRDGNKMLHMLADKAELINDDFRQDSYNFLLNNVASLRF